MILSTTLGSDNYSQLASSSQSTIPVFGIKVETYSRSISQTILFSSKNLPQNSSHDLSTPRLWQIGNDENSLWCRKRTNTFPYLQNECFLKFIINFIAILDCDESVNSLAGEFVIDTDDSGFGYGVVFDESGFNFGGRETVTRDIDDVVDTASDPVITFVIATCTVTSELEMLVCIHPLIDRTK